MPAGRIVIADREVYSLDGGAEQMLGVQRLTGLRPAPGMLEAPPVEHVDDRAEADAGRGKAVPDLPPARFTVGGDDLGVVELVQALAERLGSDPAPAVHQVR